MTSRVLSILPEVAPEACPQPGDIVTVRHREDRYVVLDPRDPRGQHQGSDWSGECCVPIMLVFPESEDADQHAAWIVTRDLHVVERGA